MLSASPALKVLTPKDSLTIVRGSCVRHRYINSDCHCCFDVCPVDALSWQEDGLHWDQNLCRSCHLCSSSCPSGALQASEFSFIALLQDLKGIQSPIIACSAVPSTEGHGQVPCLGLLADEELLLTLVLALGGNVGLNLTVCADCPNSAVIARLQEVVKQFGRFTDLDGRIELITDPEKLGYRERNFSRREFFTLLRKRSSQAGICVVDRLKPADPLEKFGTKRLPESRRLLLHVLDLLPQSKAAVIDSLFPERITTDSCRHCTGCVGICPTGALLPPPQNGAKPGFSAKKCIDCKLCEQICHVSEIQITKAT